MDAEFTEEREMDLEWFCLYIYLVSRKLSLSWLVGNLICDDDDTYMVAIDVCSNIDVMKQVSMLYSFCVCMCDRPMAAIESIGADPISISMLWPFKYREKLWACIEVLPKMVESVGILSFPSV